MPQMPDFFEQTERAAAAVGRDITGMFRHHATPMTPAAQPVNLAAAPAAARPKENPVSLITDVEDGYAAVKNEIAKLEGNLPAALEVAKKLEGNPIVQVAIKATEHVAAGLIPPEALAYLAAQFAPALEGLLSLYNPAQGAQAAPAQQPAA